jgi:cobalt/nickel transport system permease protein
MHMADTLISPAVGGTMWAVAGGLLAYCARQVRASMQDSLVPLMGVLGAFVFTAQMINFTIPGTGSSGHLGGGLMLSVLLGPHAAFLVIASVLAVQAVFFGDGGLLALGCNIFNIGFFPAFVAYPLVYRPLVRGRYTAPSAWAWSVVAAVAGLLPGAFSVVLETRVSGISELPFATFSLLMLPIHLAIGAVEGVATAAVVAFVARARPEAVCADRPVAGAAGSPKAVLIGLAAASLAIGGALSWFASAKPDGLEWSVARATGRQEVAGSGSGLHRRLAGLQEKTAVLPDYGFKAAEGAAGGEPSADAGEPWPAVSTGTSVSGVVGGLATLGLVILVGFALRARRASP